MHRGLRLIRPVLHLEHAALLDYLGRIGQPYRTDSSNADMRFTRNRIRTELVPLLKTFRPDVVRSLTALCHQAGEAVERLTQAAQQQLAQLELPRAGAVVLLNRTKFHSLPVAEGVDVLRLLWVREAWPQRAMTAALWRELAHFDGVAKDLPGGLRIEVRDRTVRLGPRIALLGA